MIGSGPPRRATSARNRGELAILLHSHMPYVEGFGTWPFGEEWLFEAAASAYIPLLEQCERWAAEGASDVLTVGVTPVLADQLVLPEVAERLVRFVRDTRAECHRLDTDGLERAGDSKAADALRESARDYEHAAGCFEALDRDLIGALRRLRDAGVIELWASAATHAILPLLATEAGIGLQVLTGIDSHRARFGPWTGGFWLPECAFRSGIDAQLAQAGVRAFCIDQTATGDPLDQLEPVAGEGGAVAIPIDWQTISLVWDDRGYPADAVYRDYHAPSMNGLRPWANSGRPYDRAAASRRAREHAGDFVRRVADRLDRYRLERGRPGLLVCALDTELLGHWWYEGPTWLGAVVEEARRTGLALATLPDALERHDPQPRKLLESSWGQGKDLGTWDAPRVAQLLWPARRAELALVAALGPSRISEGDSHAASVNGAAERAARELLALQSSDWAFMSTRDLAADYPERRVEAHAREFQRALTLVREDMRDCRDMREANGDPKLRGLAPGLRLSALLAPSSSWGR
jgi:1,4-alpha-glucan branching enzyme